MDLDPSPESPDFEAELNALLEEDPGVADTDMVEAAVEAPFDEGPGVPCLPSQAGQSAGDQELDVSHPEDLFADSDEVEWITAPQGVQEEQMAEDEAKAEDKVRAKRAKKEKEEKKKDKKKKKKKKKDKKEKKDKEEKKAAKDKKEPVVVPARVITLGALREELERYCTIQEITTQHENPWATGPHLRRPAIIAAIAERLGCSFTALTQWKTHNLCWLEFRAAQSRCVRKPETEAENVPTKMPRQLKRRSTKRQKPRRKKKPRQATKDRRNKVKRGKRRAETPEQASARREKETAARRVKRKEQEDLQARVQKAREVRKLEPKPGRLTKKELQKAKTEVERWDVECRLRGEPVEEPLWFTEAQVELQLEADVIQNLAKLAILGSRYLAFE